MGRSPLEYFILPNCFVGFGAMSLALSSREVSLARLCWAFNIGAAHACTCHVVPVRVGYAGVTETLRLHVVVSYLVVRVSFLPFSFSTAWDTCHSVSLLIDTIQLWCVGLSAYWYVSCRLEGVCCI